MAEKKKDYKGSLPGNWFHSFENDKTKWQGQILSAEPNNYFLIQLYSWLHGTPTDRKLIHFSEMVDWNFYATDKDMRYAHFKTQNRPECEFEWDEKCIEAFNKR